MAAHWKAKHILLQDSKASEVITIMRGAILWSLQAKGSAAQRALQNLMMLGFPYRLAAQG